VELTDDSGDLRGEVAGVHFEVFSKSQTREADDPSGAVGVVAGPRTMTASKLAS
jgi:hypothetical protein